MPYIDIKLQISLKTLIRKNIFVDRMEYISKGYAQIKLHYPNISLILSNIEYVKKCLISNWCLLAIVQGGLHHQVLIFPDFSLTNSYNVFPDSNLPAVQQKVTLITVILWQNMEIKCEISVLTFPWHFHQKYFPWLFPVFQVNGHSLVAFRTALKQTKSTDLM